MIIISINEEIRKKCHNCLAVISVPKTYYPNMNLETCEKVKTCPCDFNPEEYIGCIYM